MERIDEVFQILFLGETNVGKSSIATSLMNQEFTEQYEPTIGTSFLSAMLTVDGWNIRLLIWSTSGQERYRHIIVNNFSSPPAVFFVFDITNRDSFLGIETWYNLFIERNKRAMRFLVGNKTDLETNRVVTFEEANAYAASREMTYFGVSARAGNLQPHFIRSIQIIRSPDKKKAVSLRKDDGTIPLKSSCF
eukprot:TRINITY_DN10708_c0_g1_i5.p1 TRINITY_DN10708_c0_g1~~TRINITY_DN10708_c0_g1_i5.p1  ORF type:complete len:192 (-),score=17.53 TRINITY_DN10708_c0_g1_i5:112-687(-)